MSQLLVEGKADLGGNVEISSQQSGHLAIGAEPSWFREADADLYGGWEEGLM